MQRAMQAGVETSDASSGRACAVLPLAVGLLAVAVVALALAAEADILKAAMAGDDGARAVEGADGGPPGGGNRHTGRFKRAVEALTDPLQWALWTIVPIGVIVGGAMLTVGSKRGVPVIASSIGAGVAVALGLGLIA